VLVRVKLFRDSLGSCTRFDKSSGTGLSAEEYGFVDSEERWSGGCYLERIDNSFFWGCVDKDSRHCWSFLLDLPTKARILCLDPL
jgi:hypothetical protein